MTPSIVVIQYEEVVIAVFAHPGDPVTYIWDFGDGSATVEEVTGSVNHTFATAGRFTITVTAYNELMEVVTTVSLVYCTALCCVVSCYITLLNLNHDVFHCGKIYSILLYAFFSFIVVISLLYLYFIMHYTFIAIVLTTTVM